MEKPTRTPTTRRSFLAGAGAAVIAGQAVAGSSVAGTTACTAIPAAHATDAAGESRMDYRPALHYSPAQGFMNDPNGLIRLGDTYHMFYQYNPADAVAGNVHWGHATSTDLMRWTEREPALLPDGRGLAFSGSAVWDEHDSSALFGSQPGGLVAIFTRAGESRQTQDLAFGPVDGSSLTLYAGNPVLDLESSSFRDPKVFWHAASRSWVMVVVLARQHQVLFYRSPDLLRWERSGAFGHAGLLGLDYECPDLVELPVEGGGSRWVLFLSINPGAPIGGSTVQYFVGRFDGERFLPEDQATRFLDAGQDYYALQTFANTPGRVVALAWMSNWLYANDIPAHPARGAMTLPRTLSLRRRDDHWIVVQRFPDLSSWVTENGASLAGDYSTGVVARVPWRPGQALDLRLRGRLLLGSRLVMRLLNEQGECLEAGLDRGVYPGFFVDRSRAAGFDHPFWNHKAIQSVLHDADDFDCQVVIDQSSLELLGMDGEIAITLLHFFRSPPAALEVVVEHGQWQQAELLARYAKSA